MIALDDRTFVAGQIDPADLASIAAAGVTRIVNNRPDGEEPAQPRSDEVEAAARAAGLEYRHIPVAGGFSPAQVEAMAEALEDGPALLFCRSGTRSTCLWALARARSGVDADSLILRAAHAGFDLRPLAPRLSGGGSAERGANRHHRP